jgi:hypothetical protein
LQLSSHKKGRLSITASFRQESFEFVKQAHWFALNVLHWKSY